jgi:hypothetical protein
MIYLNPERRRHGLDDAELADSRGCGGVHTPIVRAAICLA